MTRFIVVMSLAYIQTAFAESNSNSNKFEDYNSKVGNSLAYKSLSRDGYASAGQCYYWAAEALESSGVMHPSDWSRLGIGTESAYMFANWADANPGKLYSELRLRRIDSEGVSVSEAPIGSVLVYHPGKCGYSSTHGHIEIVAAKGYACSDFCHYFITEKECASKPRIYMPVY